MHSTFLTKDGCRHWLLFGTDQRLWHTYELTPNGKITPLTLLADTFYVNQIHVSVRHDGVVDVVLLDKDNNLSYCNLQHNLLTSSFQIASKIAQFAVAGSSPGIPIYAIDLNRNLSFAPHAFGTWKHIGSASRVIAVYGEAPLIHVSVDPKVFILDPVTGSVEYIQLGNDGIETRLPLITNATRLAGGLSADGHAELFANDAHGTVWHCSFKGLVSFGVNSISTASASLKVGGISCDGKNRLGVTAASSNNAIYVKRQTAAGSTTWTDWASAKDIVNGLSLTNQPPSKTEEDVKQILGDLVALGRDFINMWVNVAIDSFKLMLDLGQLEQDLDENSNSGSGPTIGPAYPPGIDPGPVSPPLDELLPPVDQDPSADGAGEIDGADTNPEGEEAGTGDDYQGTQYVVARFVNATRFPVAFSFRWGPGTSWIPKVLKTGQRWMWWTHASASFLADLSPAWCSGTGGPTGTVHAVKANTIVASGSPGWSDRDVVTGGIRNTVFISVGNAIQTIESNQV
jgi:hypothetical protein